MDGIWKECIRKNIKYMKNMQNEIIKSCKHNFGTYKHVANYHDYYEETLCCKCDEYPTTNNKYKK